MELNKTLHQSITALKEGKFQEAERLYSKILQIYPAHPEANHYLGVTLYILGKLKEAEIRFKKSIELKPDYTEAYYNLGITLQKLNKLVEAEESYKKALALKPDYVDAHNNLGITLQKLFKHEEAEASYKKSLLLKPDYAITHNNLGNALKDLGRLNEAEESYKKALALKSDYKAALLNRGQVLFEKSEFELALKDFDTCNTADSRSRALTSLYALGRVEEVYERIESLSKTDLKNIRVAAFSAFLASRQNRTPRYNFCNNPLSMLDHMFQIQAAYYNLGLNENDFHSSSPYHL